jgi:hypothetical protein
MRRLPLKLYLNSIKGVPKRPGTARHGAVLELRYGDMSTWDKRNETERHV